MELEEDNYLEHYGTPRKSGRYPWGSGGDDPTNNQHFLGYVNELRQQGLSDSMIAKGLDIKTPEFRAWITAARAEKKQADIAMAQNLKDKGLSNVAIGQRMGGINESVVRGLLAPGAADRADVLNATTKLIKDEVDANGYIDVGKGVANRIGVSNERLKASVAQLQREGYEVQYAKVPQQTAGHETSLKVLAAPGTPYDHKAIIAGVTQIGGYSTDGGYNYDQIQVPLKISPDRVAVKYGPEGGAKADGVIYVRPGVDDVSLGGASYAQVRISVGNGHYLKGMAMYKDDLPDGVDLQFNTNKESTGNKLDAMKPVESSDPRNPYGSAIKRQILPRDEFGKAIRNSKGDIVPTSVMNIVNEEGDWNKWSKNLSSQMLSKQSPALAKSQLDMTYEKRLKEFQDISALTNPTVRKKLLEDFGDSTDSAAVHLKAHQLPRQRSQVILPIESMKPGEIYAPNFTHGERVVLVRHPHGGTFEIPELTVNNNQRKAKGLLGNAKDAVGIHPSVAERLSGADFDGDSVLVIPNNTGKIKTTPALDGLKNFDPKTQYKGYEGMTKLKDDMKQTQMGVVSNLITDMTLHKASTDELARAIKHSMVVIDAEKHNLDWKRSERENGIAALKSKYQGGASGGASTLISRAGSKTPVPRRKARTVPLGGPIDRETGRRAYQDADVQSFVNKAGKTVQLTTKVKKLALTDDAFTLVSGVSGTRMERVYAEHSNKLKALGNKARLDSVNTPPSVYSPTANKAYSNQVKSLNAKLNTALKNAPLERQAQAIASMEVKARLAAKPDTDKATIKKIKTQEETKARIRTGASKQRIVIEQDEWDAIQAGAISDHKLQNILRNADMDVVKKLATPRPLVAMSTADINRAATMLASGYSRSAIASALGVSISTLDESITATEGRKE